MEYAIFTLQRIVTINQNQCHTNIHLVKQHKQYRWILKLINAQLSQLLLKNKILLFKTVLKIGDLYYVFNSKIFKLSQLGK